MATQTQFPPQDPEGYLINFSDWTESIAKQLAVLDQIDLTPDHWEILTFVQEYYQTHQKSPGLRELIKAMKPVLGEEKSNSIYLFKLFPNGPAKQISKLAGLPKPIRCI